VLNAAIDQGRGATEFRFPQGPREAQVGRHRPGRALDRGHQQQHWLDIDKLDPQAALQRRVEARRQIRHAEIGIDAADARQRNVQVARMQATVGNFEAEQSGARRKQDLIVVGEADLAGRDVEAHAGHRLAGRILPPIHGPRQPLRDGQVRTEQTQSEVRGDVGQHSLQCPRAVHAPIRLEAQAPIGGDAEAGFAEGQPTRVRAECSRLLQRQRVAA
jgi:hypothetical protein